MKRHCLLALALAACSASTSSPPPPADASPADVEDVAPAPDAPAPDAPAPDAPAADRAPAGDGGGAFTMTPYKGTAPERSFAEAAMVLRPGRDYRAVLETDAGRIVLDLYEDRTPVTVNSFVFLALHHFYDGLAFHRVIENFVAQGGDPNTATDNRATWGRGGPGYTFDTETVAGLGFDGPGVLGMARSTARDSNGSQFFITLAATTSLDGNYTVFGRVTEGLDVLPRIARNQTMTTPPATPTRITRVVIEERAR